MEVHKNQKVIARGAKFALTLSRQAGLTAGTRGCHDEVAPPPYGRHDGVGVVVLLLDTGIGTCRESAESRDSRRGFGKREDRRCQHSTWHPAVAGRTRKTCGPSAGFLTAGFAPAGTCRRSASAVARRVHGGRRLGVRPDHRQWTDLGRHAWQRRADEGFGWHDHRASRRVDGAVSNRLASRVEQPCAEHPALRRFSGILRTAFLNRQASLEDTLACLVRCFRRACPIHRSVDRLPVPRRCPDGGDTPYPGSAQLTSPLFFGGVARGMRLSLLLASSRSMRVALTRSSSVAFSQDMPTAGMPFRSGAPS